MARIKARELAFKLVFEDLFGIHTAKEMFGGLFEEEKDYKVINQEDIEYIEWVRREVSSRAEELDQIIVEHTQGWTIDRLDRVDLAILRLAVCEMRYRQDVTEATAINAAVELAKAYATDNSPSFINGVLGAIAKK